jgi:hypothetical protein
MGLLTDLASPSPKPGSDVRAGPESVDSAEQDAGKPARRRGLVSWLAHSRPQSLLALPFIYSMIVPLAALDLSFSLYQSVCFRLFGIALVRRRNHFIMDRARLPYLNAVERAHCGYCSYANGVLSFAREITARTEQYWCPIKHSRVPAAVHDRYAGFIDYGDSAHYDRRLAALRASLVAEAGDEIEAPGAQPK